MPSAPRLREVGLGRQPTTDCVLAVDIGTSAVKAAAYDLRGRAIARAFHRESHRPACPVPGASEFDGDALLETVARCIDVCLDQLSERRFRPVAVGICTFWHSMLGVDEQFRPVSPLYTWADRRPGSDAAQLAAEPGAAELSVEVGCPWHASFYPARLRWLAREQPEIFARAIRWVSPGEYLTERFLGRSPCSISMASATGLLDQTACAWSERALAVAGIGADRLGALADIQDILAGLVSPWRERWPALADVPWALPIGDGAAGTLGSGCYDEHSLALNLGTSGAIRVLYEGPARVVEPGLWSYRLTRARPIAGAAFSDGGNLLRWVRTSLRQHRDAFIRRADPGQHGLVLLPTFAGERSPGWRPNATGAIVGLTLETTGADLLQAAAEAIALRFLLMTDGLKRSFPNLRRVVASGGQLAANPELPGLLADALGTEMCLLADTEASCRGAALFALLATGTLRAPEEAAPPESRPVPPHPHRASLFRAELTRQLDLDDRLARPAALR